MGFYNDRLLPHLIALGMRNGDLLPYRQRIVPAARGRVLEIGIGSGLNLPFYGPGVTEIIGLDPSPTLIAMAAERASTSDKPVSFLESSAEAIPVDTGAIDTVVTTWTMCSIPEASAALAEARRVLRPGGNLLFVEHGRAPEPSVARWQDWLDPVWNPLAGGCHLNRPIADLISGAGFRFVHLKTAYAGRPRTFQFMYEGAAQPALLGRPLPRAGLEKAASCRRCCRAVDRRRPGCVRLGYARAYSEGRVLSRVPTWSVV